MTSKEFIEQQIAAGYKIHCNEGVWWQRRHSYFCKPVDFLQELKPGEAKPKVFKSIQHVELVGFSGLMLALTEDTGLAEGTINNDFDIRALLTYSAVCGIGLDTVPVPGDTSIEKISALMRDTGTMAFRLNKPLTVRLFPVPGLKAGEMTKFESDDLCNCAVLSVP